MSQEIPSVICPQCKELIPTTLQAFQVVGCKQCGTVSVLNKNNQLEIAQGVQPVEEHPKRPLRVGKLLDYQKTTYQIASVFVYHVDYKEWDHENSKWIQDYGFIREWYAHSADGEQLILMQDTDKKYYLVSNPVQVKAPPPIDKKYTLEYGKYQFYGLLGMDKDILETKGYYRIDGQTRYECADEKFEKAAVFQYKLKPLTTVQVKRMVLLDAEDKQQAVQDFENISFYRNLFGFALLAVLFLLIINLGSNPAEVPNLRQNVKFNVAADSVGVLDTAALKPQLAGIFDLHENRNYQLSTQCYLSETNQSVDYSLTMVREADAAVVGEAALSFYTESGHDNEGYWEENLLQDKLKFQVDQTGRYQVFITPDYENLGQTPPASLEVQIIPASYSVFYLCMGCGFLLLFLIFQWQRENIAAFANLPHDTMLHDIYDSMQ